jgi:hypothetical protein
MNAHDWIDMIAGALIVVFLAAIVYIGQGNADD